MVITGFNTFITGAKLQSTKMFQTLVNLNWKSVYTI